FNLNEIIMATNDQEMKNLSAAMSQLAMSIENTLMSAQLKLPAEQFNRINDTFKAYWQAAQQVTNVSLENGNNLAFTLLNTSGEQQLATLRPLLLQLTQGSDTRMA